MYEHQRILKENFRSIKKKVTFHVGKATSYRGFIAIAAYLFARRIVEIVDCACLRREADAHLIYLTLVSFTIYVLYLPSNTYHSSLPRWGSQDDIHPIAGHIP